MSFASIGIAVTQLFRLNVSFSDGDKDNNALDLYPLRQVGKPLGATFITLAIITLLMGFHRYFQGQYYVIKGKFPASRGSIIMLSAISGALIVTSLVVVLAIKR